MKINKYYLRKSLFLKKGAINSKKIQQEVSQQVEQTAKDKLSILPQFRSLLQAKIFKPTPNGGIVEDFKKIIPRDS